ncbi:MAG: hypothetical protein ABEH77_05400 [Halobacteriaceae archaeon]
MSSHNDSEPDDVGEEIRNAVGQAIEDWLADNSSTARRVDGDIVIEEEELVEKVAIITALTAEQFAGR